MTTPIRTPPESLSTRGIADPASPPVSSLPSMSSTTNPPGFTSAAGLGTFAGYGAPTSVSYPKVYGRLGTIEMIFDGTVSTIFALARGSISLARATAAWFSSPFLTVGLYYATLARDVAVVYWNASATVRLFVYIFGLITAIPLGIFSTYAFVSFSIVMGIATTGFVIAQGLALGAGMLLLGPVLLFSVVGSLLIVVGYHLFMGGLAIWSGPTSTRGWPQQQLVAQQPPTATGFSGLLGSLFSGTPTPAPITPSVMQYSSDDLSLKQPMMQQQSPAVMART